MKVLCLLKVSFGIHWCNLGIGNVYGSSEYSDISFLRDYRICSVYFGASHILCFNHKMEQYLVVAVMIAVNFLLTLNPNEQHYYNPIITNIKNPSFCVFGAGTTAIFKNYIPPIPPNKGLNIDQFNFNQETDISMLKEKVSKLEKENEELKKQLKKKTKFFSN